MITQTLSKTVLALAIGTASLGAFAQVMVGGSPMLASKYIIDNAVNSNDHTTLVAKSAGGKVTVTDEKGGVATVTIADVVQSNGVIHVVDKVLLPK